MASQLEQIRTMIEAKNQLSDYSVEEEFGCPEIQLEDQPYREITAEILQDQERIRELIEEQRNLVQLCTYLEGKSNE